MRTARITKVDAVLVAAAIFTLSAPMLLTRSGFGADFTNALWMVWVAGKNLVQAGHPAFFTNTTTLGVFYPLFAFYGGPLYTYTGAASELLGGHAELAFIAATLLAMLGVYGAILWLGREFGLRGLPAHAPALVVLTSAYYTTDLYGRGDWTEFMVASSLAPLMASGVHLVRAKSWRPLPMAIFVASAMLFTAGHNITLLWGTTTGVGALLIVWIAQGVPRSLPYRRLAMLAGLGLVGALVNAWYLLPDMTYATKVAIGHSAVAPSSLWAHTEGFNLPDVSLNPLRRVPPEAAKQAFYVQAPDWFIVWSLFAAALLLGRAAINGKLRRIGVGASIVLVALIGMWLCKPLWQFLGYPFDEIQVPYRLSIYIYYATAGLVLVAALALQRVADREGLRPVVRALRMGLVGAVGVSLCLCIWQLWVPNTQYALSYANRAQVLASPNVAPKSWYATYDYSDWQARLAVAPANRVLYVPPSAVHGDRFDTWMNVPAGSQPIQTNIAGGSYLVHIGGLQLVGRNSEDFAVVKRVDGGGGPVHVVVETADGAAVGLGRIISRLALLATLAVLVCAAVRTRRAERGARAPLGTPI
jgi:hypothetical protein